MNAAPPRIPCRCLLALALLWILPGPALAGGFTLATFGARRGGMIATIGCPDDMSALFHNPAGLADQPGVQLYLFISPGFLDPEFRLQALDSRRYPEVDWKVGDDGYYERAITPDSSVGVLPFLGVSTDLGGLDPRFKDLVLSFAVYAPNAYAASMPADAPTAYHVIGGHFVVGSATLGLGWRIHRFLSVGAALSYNLMTISMEQKISAVDALTPAGQPPSGLGIAAQYLMGDIFMQYEGWDHGAGWIAGLLLTPLPWLNLGLTYSGATAARFEGGVSFRGSKGHAVDETVFREMVAGVGYKLPRELVVKMPIPHSLGVGLNFSPTWWLEVGLEARFWFYQLYNRQVLKPVYGRDEPGQEPMTEESLSRDKKYHMSYQLTGGLLIRPLTGHRGLELMLGTGYDQSPIPDETFTLDNPSLSHVKAACGVRWAIDPHWRVALTYYLNVFISRDITNSETSPPTNVQGSGTSHSPALEVTYRF